jgi:hypothetical protein
MVDKKEKKKDDPWAPAQEALFNMVRAWANEENADDQEAVARQCLQIMEEVNETEGAPFIFVCEMARILAIFIARYMAALNEKIPSRDELMVEIDILELEYIEEFVLAEDEDDGEDTQV